MRFGAEARYVNGPDVPGHRLISQRTHHPTPVRYDPNGSRDRERKDALKFHAVSPVAMPSMWPYPDTPCMPLCHIYIPRAPEHFSECIWNDCCSERSWGVLLPQRGPGVPRRMLRQFQAQIIPDHSNNSDPSPTPTTHPKLSFNAIEFPS